MNKIIIKTVLLFLILISSVKATNFEGTKITVAQVLPANNGLPYYSYSTFGIDIGRKYDSSVRETEIARTKYTFDLTSIPSNATINNVTLEYFCNQSTNLYFKITQIGNYLSLQDIWSNIGQSATLFSNILYGGGSLNSSTLSTLVNNNKGGYLYLGALALNEIFDYTYCNLSLTLSISYTIPPTNVTLTADNNFTASGSTNHGIIIIDGQSQTVPLSGYSITKLSGTSLSLEAVSPQTDNQNYQMIWHSGAINPSKWNRNGFPAYNNSVFTFTVYEDNAGSRYQAQLKKICNINFQNSFVGVGNGGVINVNNTQYSSPTSSFSVVELNPITALPVSGQIINGIVYNFSKWSDGNTTANRTFNPSVNTTYTAQYIGKPSTYDPNTGWSLNLHHSTTVGQPIVLYWNEHPNTYVTKYQIWKKEKYNGVTSDPILMATVNRGTTSYVDNDFVYSLLKNKYWIYYAVVPYYSLENTYSDPGWMPVTAEINYKVMDSTYTVTSTVLENSLSNFPNPFNPTTIINFSIKDAGFVNIRVFDLIGQQVAELVNEEKQAGSYSVRFDASKLPSGIYIYTINSGAFTQTRKMLLMK